MQNYCTLRSKIDKQVKEGPSPCCSTKKLWTLPFAKGLNFSLDPRKTPIPLAVVQDGLRSVDEDTSNCLRLQVVGLMKRPNTLSTHRTLKVDDIIYIYVSLTQYKTEVLCLPLYYVSGIGTGFNRCDGGGMCCIWIRPFTPNIAPFHTWYRHVAMKSYINRAMSFAYSYHVVCHVTRPRLLVTLKDRDKPRIVGKPRIVKSAWCSWFNVLIKYYKIPLSLLLYMPCFVFPYSYFLDYSYSSIHSIVVPV